MCSKERPNSILSYYRYKKKKKEGELHVVFLFNYLKIIQKVIACTRKVKLFREKVIAGSTTIFTFGITTFAN